ncbi:TspO/MBR family protein [Rubrivirga sp.]|uniref:TspO/MBR family protein n=1 Tax=Rubrivirga sp. TaxID=1885344 RepID=UPI003B52638A
MALPTPSSVTATPQRYRWWHAAAIGLTANAFSATPAGYNGDEQFYNELDTPPGSPPDWAFAPAWAFNNLTTLWSNLRVANFPAGTPGRRAALALEGANWGLFASFSGLYFGLRSPVLGAVNTVAGLGVTVASVATTARVDRKAAWALVPRLAWLGLATYVSVGTALRNRDTFVGWNPTDAPRRTTTGDGSDESAPSLEDDGA